jgi:UPF0755 protein
MRKSPILWFLIIDGIVLLIAAVAIPLWARQTYGPPSPRLGALQTLNYSVRLLWHDGLLTMPRDPHARPRSFRVEAGESVASVAARLEQDGLIYSAAAFRDYLIYIGLDTSLQAGEFELSPAQSMLDIARALQDATPQQVVFYVLPGWRMEEIAASLPTSGLNATPEQFLAEARRTGYKGSETSEGYLFPDRYILPRETTARALVNTLVKNFALHITPDIEAGFEAQGLNLHQAVTLASIVEREAVVDDEKELIASVFLNRLVAGMKLDSDPTVQYALGRPGDWWPSPLSLADLQGESPFNTYRYPGLPPAPIANPSLTSLRAVAYPAQSPYYYFRAACDNSGRHVFAQTYEEHLQNACP